MTLFSLLVEKITNPLNNIFLKNPYNIDSTIVIAFFVYPNYKILNTNGDINTNNLPEYKKKFIFLKESFEIFLIKGNDTKKNEFLDCFNKIQRLYHTLKRFIYKYKYKKSKLVVNTDMELNEIYETDKNVICIYQNNSRYLFKLFDLFKIINMALSNSYEFFAEPLCIKNPYNNIPFEKNILYYIHYFITEKTNIRFKLSQTELFLKFHSCHFNLTTFLNSYEYLLREYTINNHVKNSLTEIAYIETMIMLNCFNKNKPIANRINIDKNFPKNKLVNIFKPYLNLYNHGKYILVPHLKKKNLFELNIKLIRFQKFNPIFGRFKYLYERVINKGKIKMVKIGEEYNCKHINFEEDNTNNFLKDHLVYKYKNYTHNLFITSIIPEYDTDDDDEYEDSNDDNEVHEDNNNIVENNVVEDNGDDFEYNDEDIVEEEDNDDNNIVEEEDEEQNIIIEGVIDINLNDNDEDEDSIS
jgi:hypothetical protein